jgi:hypothetical protein
MLEAKVQRLVDGKIQILVVPMAWLPYAAKILDWTN